MFFQGTRGIGLFNESCHTRLRLDTSTNIDMSVYIYENILGLYLETI